MLLGDIKISSLMTHDHLVEGDKLREYVMENKKDRNGNYEFS